MLLWNSFWIFQIVLICKHMQLAMCHYTIISVEKVDKQLCIVQHQINIDFYTYSKHEKYWHQKSIIITARVRWEDIFYRCLSVNRRGAGNPSNLFLVLSRGVGALPSLWSLVLPRGLQLSSVTGRVQSPAWGREWVPWQGQRAPHPLPQPRKGETPPPVEVHIMCHGWYFLILHNFTFKCTLLLFVTAFSVE